MVDDKELAEATAPLSFAEFLERMKDPAAADLVRSIKNFIKTYNDRKTDPERDSQHVQQFLAKSEGAFRQHPVWATGPPEHQAQAIEGLEKYLMTKIYHKTFATSALDRERDEALSARMTALNFIKAEHLDIPAGLQDEKAGVLAMKELHKINSYKNLLGNKKNECKDSVDATTEAPRDKLVCVLNCCRIINNMLQSTMAQGEAHGADDFLPILIYVVIHANPPQLASNLEYIQRFRMQSRMVSESSYFFTQLYSAASFIETISSSSLTMDADEFVARMMAAGIPDMQLLPASAAQDDAGADVAKKPEAPPASPAPKAGAPKAEAPKAGNLVNTENEERKSRSSSFRDDSRGGLATSLEELEQAGVSYVLEAEANGELQARHPFIYANAADLRVADVKLLLSAYKHLALRYEALSLALSRRISTGSGLSPHALLDPTVYADPPPAVDGPNPFAGGSFGAVTPQKSAPVQQPQGFGSLISDLTAPPFDELLSAKPIDASGTKTPAAATSRAPSLSINVPNTSIFLSVAASNSPSSSAQNVQPSQEMLTSASLNVPLSLPIALQPALEAASGALTSANLQPEPGASAAAAAAAIESATAAAANSNRTSTETSREALADSRILTLTPEESISANELRMEHEGALSDSLSAHTQPEQMQPRRPETFPTAKTQPALASQISEVTIPRSYVSSPFGDSSTYQGVELPKPSLPNPFKQSSELPPIQALGTAMNCFSMPSSELPARASPSNSSSGTDAVPMPIPHIPSPFDEVEKSTSFASPVAPSPFEDPQTAPDQSLAPGSSIGSANPSKVPAGFDNSPFAASAGGTFKDSPSRQESQGGEPSRSLSPLASRPHPFEDSLI